MVILPFHWFQEVQLSFTAKICAQVLVSYLKAAQEKVWVD